MEGKKDVSRALFSFKAALIDINVVSDEPTGNLLPTLQLPSILLSFSLFTVIILISCIFGRSKRVGHFSQQFVRWPETTTSNES